MYFYLLVTALATFLAAVADHSHLRAMRLVMMAAVVFVFSWFAGARDVTVGTDTSFYGYLTFQVTKVYGFLSFVFGAVYSEWGILYKLVAWVTVNVFGSFAALLFALELFTVLPVVIAGTRFIKGRLAVVVALFGVFFYPLSFNLIRQSMAMGYLLLAYCELDRRRPVGFLAWLVVATLFHSSAALGLALPVIHLIARPSGFSFGAKAALFLSASLMLLFVMPYVLDALASYLPHYGVYMTSEKHAIRGHGYRNTLEFSLSYVSLLFLGCELRGERKETAKQHRVDSLLLVVLAGVVVTGLSPFSVTLGRIGMYFLLFSVLLIPVAGELISGRLERALFFVASFVIFALVAFDTFELTGQAEVVPYLFASI